MNFGLIVVQKAIVNKALELDTMKCRAFNWIERVEKSVTCFLLDLLQLLGVMMIDIGTGLLCLIPG